MKAHSSSIDELYQKYDTSFEGLSQSEAEKRIQEYGENTIDTGKTYNPWVIFFSQFTDLLVIILLCAGIITAIIGIIERNAEQVIDVIAIAVVVLLNAFLGFYQEISAEKAINSLKQYTMSEIIVTRDKKKKREKAVNLVPGDIVFIETGDQVPADIRIIQSYEIRTNESILTGESTTVKKRNEILPENTSLADRTNMLFKGTAVVNGTGVGLVVATAMDTELGKIAFSLKEIKTDDTPIKKKLANLAKNITYIIISLSVIILILGLFLMKDTTIAEIFIFAIGLAVAAVPEGLPAVLTLSLALGVTRMARKKALIRKLPAVEVLGSTTTICTDKTGTLTRNQMTVKALWTTKHRYEVTGSGYLNNGDILESDSLTPVTAAENETLKRALEICNFANESSIEEQGPMQPYKTFGDPTEIALLILVEKGKNGSNLRQQWSKEYVFPFDSNRKRMSTIIKNKETGKYIVVVKGALDILLELCDKKYEEGKEKSLKKDEKERIQTVSDNYSSKFAYRVLGLAFKDIDEETAKKLILSEDNEKVEKELTFVGFSAMIDPARDETRPAIEKAYLAGINVKMITGDHMTTAEAIAREINLQSEVETISGNRLDHMSEEELDSVIDNTNIFARVSPQHKLSIVNSLKRKGEIVVMTGDGVNDAPALKRADIGVAMGITGTDVSKEASDMVLVDDNFANIIDAIEEGRIIYDNMKRFITYLLSANAGEILTVIFAMILGMIFHQTAYIPILAIQLLFINLLTDTFPAIALGVTPPEGEIMLRAPRDPDEPLLDKEVILTIFLTGFIYAIGTMILFFWALDRYDTDTKIAETMVFTALVFYQLFHSLSVSKNGTIFNKKIFEHKSLFLAIFVGATLQLMAIYMPGINTILHTAQLEWVHWKMILLTLIPIAIIGELKKLLIKHKVSRYTRKKEEGRREKE